MINDCINIENNNNEIKRINENINKCKNNIYKNKITLLLNDDEINKLSENIKNLGKINITSGKIFGPKIDENLVKDWIGKNFISE